MIRTTALRLVASVAILTVALPLAAADWPSWRGETGQGASPVTGLVASWSAGGANLIWRDDWTGRSTPVVFAGRVCANGRRGDGITRQEAVACWDAESGTKLWEKRFNVYHTTVPWNRVGWAHVTGDPETGYLYVQGVGGLFFCLDSATGEEVWFKRLVEEYGFMEGYGGRTQTPTIDEDRVIVTFASTSWGEQARPLHRLYAFDKRTGEPIWASSPASSMADKNTQSTPVVAVIAGQRLVIAGNGGGWIYAVKARTGEKVWGFQLSKRGLNTSVVVDGDTVYAAHSEENVDEPTMGRVVAIDGTGRGDITKTHEKWRAPYAVGFSTPALAGGVLYAVDNSADLHALDATTGRQLWEVNLGTVGKGSPVVADGKLYVAEVNGKFHILGLGEGEPSVLDSEQIDMPEGRYAEIYGSPAVAYGRVYFTTEEGIYCLGRADQPFVAEDGPRHRVEEPPAAPGAAAASILVVPAEVWLRPGESTQLRVRAFDDHGRPLGERPATAWSLAGLSGTVSDGVLTPAANVAHQAGQVEARLGELSATARVRVVGEMPYAEDFEQTAVGSRPDYFLGYVGRFEVAEVEGNKVLVKGPSPVKIHRHHTLLGRSDDHDYTIQADLLGVKTGRKAPDMGLINSGYTMDLMYGYQQIQIRSWASALRMAEEVPFSWQPDVWYTMKLRVDTDSQRALIRGKVWPKGTEEPAEWNITVEDPLPIDSGSPGLYGYSPSPIYYDNVEVTKNR